MLSRLRRRPRLVAVAVIWTAGLVGILILRLAARSAAQEPAPPAPPVVLAVPGAPVPSPEIVAALAAARLAEASAAKSDPLSSPLTGQVVLVLLSVISTGAMLWKTSRDQSHALDVIRLQHEVDAADRREKAASERADRDSIAAGIRERLLTDATTLQSQVQVTAEAVRNRVDAVASKTDAVKEELKGDQRLVVALQTAELKAAIDAAKTFGTERADLAIQTAADVSSDVNDKLRLLTEAHAQQGEVLRHLLDTIAKAQTPILARRASDPPGAIVGRRASDLPGFILPEVRGTS